MRAICLPMLNTGKIVIEGYGVSLEEQDAFALTLQERTVAAQEFGPTRRSDRPLPPNKVRTDRAATTSNVSTVIAGNSSQILPRVCPYPALRRTTSAFRTAPVTLPARAGSAPMPLSAREPGRFASNTRGQVLEFAIIHRVRGAWRRVPPIVDYLKACSEE